MGVADSAYYPNKVGNREGFNGFVDRLNCPKGDMKHMRNIFVNLLRDDSGQDLIEYALVAALIGLGATVAMKTLTNSIGSAFNKVGTDLTNAIP